MTKFYWTPLLEGCQFGIINEGNIMLVSKALFDCIEDSDTTKSALETLEFYEFSVMEKSQLRDQIKREFKKAENYFFHHYYNT